AQFERSPGSLDPEWREFFGELLGRVEAAALAGDGKPATEPSLPRRESGIPATLEPGYDWSASARPDSSASARPGGTMPSEPEKTAEPSATPVEAERQYVVREAPAQTAEPASAARQVTIPSDARPAETPATSTASSTAPAATAGTSTAASSTAPAQPSMGAI